MTPPVDHPPEEETEMLLLAAERRRRKARVTLRRRLYLAGIFALVATTTALGIVNLNVAHQATAQSQPPPIDSVAPVAPAPPKQAPMAEPKSEPAIDPESATPKPPSVAPKPPIKRDPSRTVIVTREPTPTKPATPPKPAAAYIEAKSDPAIVKPPAVASPVSPAPEPPKVVQPRESAPPIFHKPVERLRDVEAAQAPGDATGRVAHWMAETYGQRDAERRAELAGSLYPETDARTVHWRKVLEYLRETD